MLSQCLSRQKIYHTVCVATEYGEEVLDPSQYARIHQGRLDTQAMTALMRAEAFAAAVDATHPYAVDVSRNIKAACAGTGMPYLRYLRSCDPVSDGLPPDTVYVNSAGEAACYLEGQTGRIFLTTGSKELPVFVRTLSDRSRLFARVLPSAQVVADCRALGLEGKQLCAMQGPFSEEMNRAMLQQTKAAFLVTKDTGAAGGYPEKERAARALGIRMVVIRRPEETGLDLESLLKRLEELLEAAPAEDARGTEEKTYAEIMLPEEAVKRTEETQKLQLSCIGIGMGTVRTLTHESAEAIRQAQILFGARRILESVQAMRVPDGNGRETVPLVRPEQVLVTEYEGSRIAAYLREHPQYKNAAVLMSGDVGFYSGARGIEASFPASSVRYFCGISSVVYFASRVPTTWQDAKLLSAHGKQISLLNVVQRYPKLILLVSGVEDVKRICRELCEAGMQQVRVTVGTNLSYPEETITTGSPEEFLEAATTGLHILMLENPEARHVISPGMTDEAFVRGKVPMTKEEIRILSVAKLQLTEDAVVYDVGAGTGSVSMECARLCTFGTVYAIERNPEGIALIRENSCRLHLSNVVPVEGLAPQALLPLPAPTHAFIGGSAGNMGEIIDLLREKNPQVRIVINTIALESIAEVTALLKERQIEADIVQISAAKARKLGRYHMMTGLNPVYIISF